MTNDDIPQDTTPTLELVDAADPRVTYNTDALDSFLDLVFHKVEDDDEHILLWDCQLGRPGGFPKGDKEFLKQLNRRTAPRSLYFGTGSAGLNDREELRNRGASFKRLHVIVLDDIGTKVPLEKVAHLTPTYIIESAPGNQQWGFVLQDPVTDIAQAGALIKLIYSADLSDGGGAIPMKMVRLPDGFNGKQGENRLFHVELIKDDGPYWDVAELLTAMDLGVTWDEIVADPGMLDRKRSSPSRSLYWAEKTPVSPNLNGTIDPILEWLYDNDMVLQETGDWVTILCPQHFDHTTGEMIAGYSPLGRGDDLTMRQFNCFHDSCKTYKTSEFLGWVANQGGPHAGVFDVSAHLLADWAFFPPANAAVHIDHENFAPVPIPGLKGLHPFAVNTVGVGGKIKSIPSVNLWHTSPMKAVVYGQVYDPATEGRITTIGVQNFLNKCYKPDFGRGAYDQDDVDKFKQFMEYLCPVEEEHSFVMQWLCAKVQDLCFRGPALLMVAEEQGTGRTTMADMIAELIGTQNRTTESFKTLVSGKADGFNQWLEYPLVIAQETQAVGDEEFAVMKAYERLKEIVDPRPTLASINRKYGVRTTQMVYSSFLFFSNHPDAMRIGKADRRFYVVQNAYSRETPAYFTELNRWLGVKDDDGLPKWARSVYRWMMEQTVDVEALMAPATETNTKRVMREMSTPAVEQAVQALFSLLPSDTVTVNVPLCLKLLMDQGLESLGLENHPAPSKRIATMLRQMTKALPVKCVVKVNDVSYRNRAIKALWTNRGEDDWKLYSQADLKAFDEQDLSKRLTKELEMRLDG